MGAAAAHRYVSRKATIAILNHRKTSERGSPWEALGVSESRYYELLKQFAPRPARGMRSMRACWNKSAVT
jgi:hypothetical protein